MAEPSAARPARWRRTALLLVAAVGACGSAAVAAADSMVLTGAIGTRAILVINGTPKTLAPGESFQNVRLVSMQNGEALVEAGGRRVTLRMDSPVSIGAREGTDSAGGSRIVLNADSRGHFMAPGSINGRQVNFLLDTGATTVALSIADAVRLGIDYEKGAVVRTSTANGSAVGYRLRLATVRVGDVEVREVDAIVLQQPMPYVLLGNSFIGRFSMRRDAEQLVLERRF